MAGYLDPESEEYQNAAYACPGCGRRYDYQRVCTGSGEAPHEEIEVVETSELLGSDAESLVPE